MKMTQLKLVGLIIDKSLWRTALIYPQRWWLLISLAEGNDNPKLELPRAWEPRRSKGVLSLSEGKSPQNIVSYGDKKNNGRNEKYSSRITVWCNANSTLPSEKGGFNDAVDRSRSGFSYPNLYLKPYWCSYTHQPDEAMENYRFLW